MGTLIPGATYIYENDGHKIYAREAGSLDRKLVGEILNTKEQQLEDDRLWRQIRTAAETDPTLRDAVDKVLMIYRLSQTHG